ncbi:hypothetical protein OU798_07515 [Prolixibacteraceae bacterium Z1-6]|uniref:Uncharacterized protein n=1 Tax=Draconibacterium aestuarii TaxID=2998507 RepID=A0A9X3FC53_9BACT|nr:hypothetical protein [Prolixibacteraceae bacterium Z1-6]
MNENTTGSTMVPAKRKYPTLRELDFNRKYLDKDLETDIAGYEREFKYLDRDKYPTRWYYVQMELAELYRRLMFRWKNER